LHPSSADVAYLMLLQQKITVQAIFAVVQGNACMAIYNE
jgi:hypothetical protein